MALLAGQSSWAQGIEIGLGVVSEVPTVTGGQSSNLGDTVSYNKLVDGDLDTKYALSLYTPWVEFNYSDAIVPKGYIIWTADNSYGAQNPSYWEIKAKVNVDDPWTTLTTVSNGMDEMLPMENNAYAIFRLDNNTAYKYFRFEAYCGSGGKFQLSELQFFVNPMDKFMSYATVGGLTTPYYERTGFEIGVDFTVTDAGGKVLERDVDYTASIFPPTVLEDGDYTLTINGKYSYYGTRTEIIKVRKPLSGSGTKDDPYLIKNNGDWDVFANWINTQNGTYGDKYYRLDADISVSTIAAVGSDNAFKGTFDGNGHTITVNLTDVSSYGCALFQYAESATFTRIHVAGTINTARGTAGGLVGAGKYSSKPLTIKNCWSSVTIKTSHSNASSVGALIGYYDGVMEMSNCLFDGSFIYIYQAVRNGGMAGNASNYGKPTVKNCLFAPTSIVAGGQMENCTVVHPTVSAIINCYYTQSFGEVQGTAVGSMTNAELKDALGSNWEIVGDKVVPIMDKRNLGTAEFDCPPFFGYTGYAINVSFSVKDMDGDVIPNMSYSVGYSPFPVMSTGEYTVTVTGKDNYNYCGTLSHSFRVIPQISGSGTEQDPFVIGSTSDWNTFADAVANGCDYQGKIVKLTDDITVSRMVGVLYDYPFRGTFDGDGHTLTADIVSTTTGTDPNDQGVAPFHYIYEATIKNLTVAGEIRSNSYYTGGVVGFVGGRNNQNTEYRNMIKDCVVTATLTIGCDHAGGIVGNGEADALVSNYTTVSNCVFAGTIRSKNSDMRADIGGIWGWGSSNCYINYCLEMGTYVNISSMNPRALQEVNRGSGSSFCYVNDQIGTPNGNVSNGYYYCHKVYASEPTDCIYKEYSSHGYTYYEPVVVKGLRDTYPYNDGNPVNLGYSVVYGDYENSLTKNTHYVVVLDPGEPVEKGSYTIRFVAKEGNYSGYKGQTDAYHFTVGDVESLDGYQFAWETIDDQKVYKIENESDLENLAAYVNSGHNASGKTFRLTNSFTMVKDHTAIGKDGKPFCGTFDGNGKVISNLSIHQSGYYYQGLFGKIEGNAVVKDLTLENCYVAGENYVGFIVGGINGSNGSNRATIRNCHVSGVSTSTWSYSYHGGIAGQAGNTDIIDCSVDGSVTSVDTGNYYGGIVGYASGNVNVQSCENRASVTCNGSNIGGIVGWNSGASNTYRNCLNLGVTTGGSSSGAISGNGNYHEGSFSDCYYAYPCTVKALNNSDVAGYAERVYAIKAGEHVTGITVAGNATVTSLSGDKYYAPGEYTLTATLEDGLLFATYMCVGGSMSNLDVAGGNHTLTIVRGQEQDVTISASRTTVGVLNDDDGITDAVALSVAGLDVSFERSFTAGVASTICLPFDMASVSGGKVYEFRDVTYDDVDGWVATMTDATPSGNKVTSTVANKPYLFLPTANGTVTFSGTVSADPESLVADEFTSGDWIFHGTYRRMDYGEDEFVGTVFGFAATNGKAIDGVTDVYAGDFVKAATGAFVQPFRAYLTYKGSNTALRAPGRGVVADPANASLIKVRLLGAGGEITGIGTIDMNTGEITIDRWYYLNGQPVEGTPAAPGFYLNAEGRKVMITE